MNTTNSIPPRRFTKRFHCTVCGTGGVQVRPIRLFARLVYRCTQHLAA